MYFMRLTTRYPIYPSAAIPAIAPATRAGEISSRTVCTVVPRTLAVEGVLVDTSTRCDKTERMLSIKVMTERGLRGGGRRGRGRWGELLLQSLQRHEISDETVKHSAPRVSEYEPGRDCNWCCPLRNCSFVVLVLCSKDAVDPKMPTVAH